MLKFRVDGRIFGSGKYQKVSFPPSFPSFQPCHAVQSTFIDKVRIYARGGTGGQGSSKLGCVGGLGGDVSVCAMEGSNLRDIAHLKRRRFVAGVGGMSERSSAAGKKGAGITLSVPPGTVVYDDQETMVTT